MKGLVVFDLDGTLLRTHHHVCKAAKDTLRELRLPIVEDEVIINLIGETSTVFCTGIVPDYEDIDRVESLFRANERSALIKDGKLYDGIPDLLSNLIKEGYQLAICSSGSMEYIELALETTGIRSMFNLIVSSKDFASKSQAVKELVNSIMCDNIILVGDRYHDFIAAEENHIPFIAALYGYGITAEINMTSFTALVPEDIFPLIKQISLYSQIYSQVKQTDGVRCIGVNGVDTSGKSIFATRFAALMKSKGEHVAVIHLDDFHNPKSLRIKGCDEIDAYITNAFDLKTLVNQLLSPIHHNGEVYKELMLLDLDSDTYTHKCKFDIGEETIVILEGVLLYREPIEDYLDFKIFLDINFDEVIHRATIRDVPKYGVQFLAKYRNKYIPIQKWYLNSCKPKEKSNIIIDNSNVNDPYIV